MFLDDNIARLRRETRTPFAAPAAFGEHLPLGRLELAWVRMVPGLVVARLPTMMRNNEDLDAVADTSGYGSQIIEQTDFPGDALHGRPKLATFGQEIVGIRSAQEH